MNSWLKPNSWRFLAKKEPMTFKLSTTPLSVPSRENPAGNHSLPIFEVLLQRQERDKRGRNRDSTGILFLNRIVQKLVSGDTTLDGRLHKISCTNLPTVH
jgi:hypothetical protein